jgi:hypothetical protein
MKSWSYCQNTGTSLRLVVGSSFIFLDNRSVLLHRLHLDDLPAIFPRLPKGAFIGHTVFYPNVGRKRGCSRRFHSRRRPRKQSVSIGYFEART